MLDYIIVISHADLPWNSSPSRLLHRFSHGTILGFLSCTFHGGINRKRVIVRLHYCYFPCRPAVEQFTQRVFGLPSKHFFPQHETMLRTLRSLLGPDDLPDLARSLLDHMGPLLASHPHHKVQVGCLGATHYPETNPHSLHHENPDLSYVGLIGCEVQKDNFNGVCASNITVRGLARTLCI